MLERYTLPEMKELWSEEKKYATWLKVELAFLKAREKTGDLLPCAYAAIEAHAKVDISRIAAFEAEYRHDFEAFVGNVRQSLEKANFGKYKHEFHKPLTSYSVEDPTLILLLRDAVQMIINKLIRLVDMLHYQAQEHQWSIMSARTHGQDAKPSTFGHLLAVFLDEIQRNIVRLDDWCLESELAEANMSGAVGNYMGIDPRWEKEALHILGLLPANAETQALGRDRHAMILATLAVIASSIERMAVTLRQMAHACVKEVQEPFVSGQRGSSAMPHKRNPVKLEQMSGLARIVRGYAGVAMENIAQWEWHDISHSSAERHILSGATSLVHYMVVTMADIMRDLEVRPEQMWKNLWASGEVWASQAVREALTDAGVDYDIAYRYVQAAAFRAPIEKASFREVLQNMPLSDADERTAFTILGSERFNQCFDVRAALTPGIEHIFSNMITRDE